MRNKNIIFILLSIVLISCGEDRRPEYANQTAYDRWMENTMRDNYYWYDEMSSPKKVNYFLPPGEFLKERLATKDAGYSYVEELDNFEPKISYGLKYDTPILYDDTAYAVRVLYVDSDSPAKEVGLQRGDWIYKTNDKYITKNRIDSLKKGKAIQLTRGERIVSADENEDLVYTFNEIDRLTMPASRVTADKPIHTWATYLLTNKTVGYLSYNNYASGNGGGDSSYDDELINLSKEFKTRGVTDFILDLRYNSGGSFSNMRLLATILAPEEALGQPMCHLEYNQKHTDKNETILFDASLLKGGANLNMKSLYIITGSTTGTQTDILINALNPYMEKITLVGSNTKGNYTLTHPYKSEEQETWGKQSYVLHLVDCMAYNKDHAIDPAANKAEYVISEIENVEHHQIYPLGEPKELLLYLTLYVMEYGALPEE